MSFLNFSMTSLFSNIFFFHGHILSAPLPAPALASLKSPPIHSPMLSNCRDISPLASPGHHQWVRRLSPDLLSDCFSQSDSGRESDLLQAYDSYSNPETAGLGQLFFLIHPTNAR